MGFTALFSYVLITTITPGPNNIMAMSNASKFGFKKGFRFNIGVLLGILGVLVCCAIFSTLLFSYIPIMEPAMRYIGAVYIIWLAWSIFREHQQEKKKRLETNSIVSGMVLQFINVKVIIYGITVMSTFILPYYKSPEIIALFVISLSIVGFAGTCCWALFGAVFEKIFREHKKLLNTIMALLLVYCAISLIIK